jgi:deoxycytidine triphosphate deaminase
LTDKEIKQAMEKGDIVIEPFEGKQLQSATYDMRLGKRAIISKTVTLEELEKQITREEAKEIDIENPSLLDNMGSTVVAIAEARIDVGTWSPFIRYSNDGGNNWLPDGDFLTWQGMEDV